MSSPLDETAHPPLEARKAWALYVRWCEVNEKNPLPGEGDEAPDQQTLRFLHAHYGQWGEARARALVSAIGGVFVSNGIADPRTYRVQAYVDHLGTVDSPRDHTAAATAEQLVLMAHRSHSFHPLSAMNTRLRGVLALALARRQDPTNPLVVAWAASLPSTAFRMTDEHLDVTFEEGVVTIDRLRSPVPYLAMRASLEAAPPGVPPLASRPGDRMNGGIPVVSSFSQDAGALRRAWRRAGLGEADTRSLASAVRSTLDALADDQVDRWIEHVDPNLRQRVRAFSYLLVGCVACWRAADMARLALREVERTRTGFRLRVWVHKGVLLGSIDEAAGPITADIDHLADDPRSCDAPCPACWLDRQLGLRTLDGAAPEDAVWVSRVGQPITATTCKADLDRLHALLSDEEAEGLERLTSRDMRTTGITAARKAGEDYASIAARTGHRRPSVTDRYVRRERLDLDNLVLPFETPTN